MGKLAATFLMVIAMACCVCAQTNLGPMKINNGATINNSDDVAQKNVANTWTGAQTFNRGFTGAYSYKGPFAAGRRFDHYSGFPLSAFQYTGGLNANVYGFNGKTTLEGSYVLSVRSTPSQQYGYHGGMGGFSPGDVVGQINEIYGPAGFRDPGDEGIEVGTFVTSESTCVYRGTVVGSPATGATAIQGNPTSLVYPDCPVGVNPIGEGRYVLNTSTGTVTATASALADNVQQFASTYGYFSTVTLPSVTTSTGYGTLTGAISVGGSATIPGTTSVAYTLTGGSLTTGLACVGDQSQQSNTVNGQGNFETINITVVAGGSLTAVFQRPHPIGAAIFQGGYCGRFIEVVADTFASGSSWSNGEFGGTTSYPVRYAWPILGSTNGTTLVVWTARAQGGGFWSTFANTAVKTVNIYKGAEAYSVIGANSDTSDNQFTLAPNAIVWTSGDSLEQSHYPAQHVTGPHVFVSRFGHNGFGSQLLDLEYYGVAENQDLGIITTNNAAYASYTAGGGSWLLPKAAWEVRGPWTYVLSMNGNAFVNSIIGLPCYTSVGCGTDQNIVSPLGNFSIANGDNLAYNNTAREWRFYAQSGGLTNPMYVVDANGIRVDITQQRTLPSIGLGAQSSTRAYGLKYSSGSLGVVAFQNGFGSGGIDYFVDGVPDSSTAPTNTLATLHMNVGWSLRSNLCYQWTSSTASAGTANTNPTAALALCQSVGGATLGTTRGGTDASLTLGKVTANVGIQAGSSGSTISDTREIFQSVHYCGTTGTCSNTANIQAKFNFGTITLAAGTATLTLPAASNLISCGCSDLTTTNGCHGIQATSTTVTFTGNATDTVRFDCVSY